MPSSLKPAAIAADPGLIAQLRSIVGDAGLVTDADLQAGYLTDWLGKWHGSSSVIVRPRTTKETADVMALCHEMHLPVVTQGGNTGMSGGATPDLSGGQVLLSMARMDMIRGVDPDNNTMTVEAGVVLSRVQAAAREANRFFPLSLGSEQSCTIGGNLATNAGGVAVLRYGNMRDLVLGLEVVLPDGRIWNGLRALRKDNTGYDLKQLFIGSEGTLGVITAAVLKLHAQPIARATAWVGAETLEALVDLLGRVREAAGDRLVAFEMLSRPSLDLVLAHVVDSRSPLAEPHAFHALIELADTRDDGLASLIEGVLSAALEPDLVQDAVIAQSGAQASAFWRLREGISQAQVRAGKAVKHDIAVPISALPDFCAKAEAALRAYAPDCAIINFGHLGDGNLHYNILLPLQIDSEHLHRETLHLNRIVHDLVQDANGSISAEHGVGQLRRDELRHYKSPIEMEMMRTVKRAFDPDNRMNPGKLL
jgi:FAD/FMN-containing dehydrogenase